MRRFRRDIKEITNYDSAQKMHRNIEHRKMPIRIKANYCNHMKREYEDRRPSCMLKTVHTKFIKLHHVFIKHNYLLGSSGHITVGSGSQPFALRRASAFCSAVGLGLFRSSSGLDTRKNAAARVANIVTALYRLKKLRITSTHNLYLRRVFTPEHAENQGNIKKTTLIILRY